MAKRGRPKGSKKVISIVPKAKPSKPNGQPPLAAAREMPAGEDAEQALRLLADLNDRVKRYEIVEVEKKSAYLEAKADREAAQAELLDKLWKVTHTADMPLFDSKQAEQDLSQIQEAAVSGSVMEAADEASQVPNLTLPAGEAPQTDAPPADDMPF